MGKQRIEKEDIGYRKSFSVRRLVRMKRKTSDLSIDCLFGVWGESCPLGLLTTWSSTSDHPHGSFPDNHQWLLLEACKPSNIQNFVLSAPEKERTTLMVPKEWK